MRSATSEPDPALDKIRGLEERLDKFRISSDSAIIAGSAWQGYAVNIPFCDETTARPTCVCDSVWDCVGGCAPPDPGDCTHYISFQVRLTQCDIDSGFCQLFQFNLASVNSAFDVFVDESEWGFRQNGAINADISTDDVPLVACQCYDVLVAFSDPGGSDPVDVTFCVNGVTTTTTLDKAHACNTISGLFIGDPYGGNNVANRKYRRVVVNGGPGPNFDLSTDSFDSLVNASIITEGGENVLLVNSGADAGYGETDISWKIGCSCNACCLPDGDGGFFCVNVSDCADCEGGTCHAGENCNDIDCSCLPEFCGAVPFVDDDSNCWMTFNTDCDGVSHFSDPTPCDSFFRFFGYTRNHVCAGCVEGDPDTCTMDCSITFFSDEGGCESSSSPDGCQDGGTCTCTYDETQFVSDLLPPPC